LSVVTLSDLMLGVSMVSSIVLGVIHAVCRNANSGYAEYHFIILLGVLMLGQHYYSDSHLTACHYAQRRYDEFRYTLRVSQS